MQGWDAARELARSQRDQRADLSLSSALLITAHLGRLPCRSVLREETKQGTMPSLPLVCYRLRDIFLRAISLHCHLFYFSAGRKFVKSYIYYADYLKTSERLVK